MTLNWKGIEDKEKQVMPGHKSYTTTRIYDHVEPEMPTGLLKLWGPKGMARVKTV